MTTLFSTPGRFWRGNLHTHSTRSDGGRTPEEVCADYRAHGYDFISLTDHFLPNSWFRKEEDGFVTVSDTSAFHTDDFITVFGAEIHGPAMENGEIWHLVAVGLPLDFAPLGEQETGLEIARRAREAGAWVSLAHPYWNLATDADALAAADIIHAVEVYNHASEVSLVRGWAMPTAEALLQSGHRVQMNAADDAHIRQTDALRWIDAFGGWVMVHAPELTPGAILAALKAGDYYSSTGPEIHAVEITETHVRVISSNVQRVIVSGKGAISTRAYGTNLVDTTVALPPREKTPWIRLTVVDAAGRMAWTNPVWFD